MIIEVAGLGVGVAAVFFWWRGRKPAQSEVGDEQPELPETVPEEPGDDHGESEVGETLGDYKLLMGQRGQHSAQLFNVVEDPSEQHDLATEMPDKMQELMKRLAYWNSTAVGDVAKQRGIPEMAANPALHGGVWTPWA